MKRHVKTVIRKTDGAGECVARDVALLIAEDQISDCHAYRLPGLDNSTYRYEATPDGNAARREAPVTLTPEAAVTDIAGWRQPGRSSRHTPVASP